MLVSKFSLYDHIPHTVFVLIQNKDRVPRFAFINKHALEIACLPAMAIIGKSIQDMLPRPRSDVAYRHHCAAFHTGEAKTYQIAVAPQKLLQTTLTPVFNDAGIVTHVVGISLDVSDRAAVSELQTHAATLGQNLHHSLTPQTDLSSEIEDFVSLAAHDLRTPIVNVGMLANLLRDELAGADESKLELVDALEDISTRTLVLISDVLAHASATSTQADVAEFEFSEMVINVIAMLDPMKHCNFTVTPCKITGDRAATQIILRNLIDNALKHAVDQSDVEDLRLTIAAERDDTHGFFRIHVTDNGRGISPEPIQYLNSGEFKPNTGFGLVGTRRLLHARGGSITATNSETGSGTVISFSLPGTLIAAS